MSDYRQRDYATSLVRHPVELTDTELDLALRKFVRAWLDAPVWRPWLRLRARLGARWLRRVQRDRERLHRLEAARRLDRETPGMWGGAGSLQRGADPGTVNKLTHKKSPL